MLGDELMKVSVCIELVWKLAAQEAIAGEFKEIEPDHFFAGLLKFSELPVEKLVAAATDAPPAKQLAAEVTALRNALGDYINQTTRWRRELRAQLGKGGVAYKGGEIHRSSASRDLFDSATRLADDAGSEALAPAHLLAALLTSPTLAMTEVLGGIPLAIGDRVRKCAFLNEFGKDLTRIALNGELPEVAGRQAECRILLETLASKRRKSVLLVSDNDAYVRRVVYEAARAIGSQKPPPALRGRRIIDVTRMKPGGKNDAETLERLQGCLAEAGVAREIILFGPEIGFVKDNRDLNEWGKLLRAALLQGGIQCVCRVPRMVYQTLVHGDSEWRNHVEIVFIHGETSTEVPNEL